MKEIWNKIKKWFTPYSDISIKEDAFKEVEEELQEEVTKRVNVLYSDVKEHIDRRIDALLTARAKAKSENGKRAYNGTIKELRAIKEML